MRCPQSAAWASEVAFRRHHPLLPLRTFQCLADLQARRVGAKARRRDRRTDRRTAEAVLARDAAAIGPDDACGVFALRGAVELARQRGWAIRMLDLRTSGDIAGDPTWVVGYGAFAIAGG